MLARAFAQVVKVKGKIGNISIGSYILDFWIAMTKSKLLNKYQCWKLMWWVHTSAVSLSLIISLFHFFFLNGFFILWDSLVNGEWTWLWKWERVCVYVLYTRHCLPLDASFEKLVTLSLSSPLVSVLPIRIQNRVLSLSVSLNNQTKHAARHFTFPFPTRHVSRAATWCFISRLWPHDLGRGTERRAQRVK